ncbi:MAG: polysaccharide deacetylase family protein [Gemmatimonadota bacterium]
MRAVLTYHSIDESGSVVSIPLSSFRAHVRWLASGDVRAVPLGQVLEAPDSADVVAVTFDDGFENLHRDAWPLLREHNIPFTVFVVTDHVGGMNNWGGSGDAGVPRFPLMSWPTLGRLREGGASIGAHTRRHPSLPSLAPAAVEEELRGSAEAIERELGVPPDSFAYPYGETGRAASDCAARTFRLSCTTEHRPLRGVENSALIPRLDMWYFRDPRRLESWGSSSFRRALWIRGQARRARRMIGRFGQAGRGAAA